LDYVREGALDLVKLQEWASGQMKNCQEDQNGAAMLLLPSQDENQKGVVMLVVPSQAGELVHPTVFAQALHRNLPATVQAENVIRCFRAVRLTLHLAEELPACFGSIPHPTLPLVFWSSR
jgi:hypothetical protein